MLLLWEALNRVKDVNNNVKNAVFGCNNHNPRYHCSSLTTHAEMECVKRLAFQMSKRRLRRTMVDLVVIRASPTGVLGNSQPCRHCAIELMKHKHIQLRNIYFSNSKGDIEKHCFHEWFQKTDHHTSSGWTRVHM